MQSGNSQNLVAKVLNVKVISKAVQDSGLDRLKLTGGYFPASPLLSASGRRTWNPKSIEPLARDNCEHVTFRPDFGHVVFRREWPFQFDRYLVGIMELRSSGAERHHSDKFGAPAGQTRDQNDYRPDFNHFRLLIAAEIAKENFASLWIVIQCHA